MIDTNVGTVHPTTTVKTEAATDYRTKQHGLDHHPTTTETTKASSSTTMTNMIEWNAIETIAEEILYHPSSSSSSSSSRMSGLVGTLYCNDTQCKNGQLNMGVCVF